MLSLEVIKNIVAVFNTWYNECKKRGRLEFIKVTDLFNNNDIAAATEFMSTLLTGPRSLTKLSMLGLQLQGKSKRREVCLSKPLDSSIVEHWIIKRSQTCCSKPTINTETSTTNSIAVQCHIPCRYCTRYQKERKVLLQRIRRLKR